MVFCVVWFNSVWWFLCQKCCLSPGSTKQILARVCKLINVSAPKAPSAALFGDRKSSVKKYGCPVLRDRVFLIVHLLVDYCKTLVPFGLLNLSCYLPLPRQTQPLAMFSLMDCLLPVKIASGVELETPGELWKFRLGSACCFGMLALNKLQCRWKVLILPALTLPALMKCTEVFLKILCDNVDLRIICLIKQINWFIANSIHNSRNLNKLLKTFLCSHLKSSILARRNFCHYDLNWNIQVLFIIASNVRYLIYAS